MILPIFSKFSVTLEFVFLIHFVMAHNYSAILHGTPGDGRRNPRVPRNPGWESLIEGIGYQSIDHKA